VEAARRLGLAASGRYGGKLYGVPYYAGSRVITYRTDLFKKAGIKVPTSLAQFTAGGRKLAAQNKQKGFSPVYIAGTDWYVAMGFVYDFGGKIATQVSGKWKGTLASPRARMSAPAEAFPDSIVLARWEDAESLLTLVRGSYNPEFQLILVSKPLSARARNAVREAIRLDAIEAPRREAEQRKKEAGDASIARDKNKAAFRP